jgi:hypothetical protein
VKEISIETFEKYDQEGQYPFGGNRLFLAEFVSQFRSLMGDVASHTMRLVIRATPFWDWAMISGSQKHLLTWWASTSSASFHSTSLSTPWTALAACRPST